MSGLATWAAAGAAVALAAALEQLGSADARPAAPGAIGAGGAVVGGPRAGGTTTRPRAFAVAQARVSQGAGRHLFVAVLAGCAGMLLLSASGAVLIGGAAGGASAVRARSASKRRARACDAATPMFARVLADGLRGGASIRSALAGAATDRSIPEVLRTALADEVHALSAGAALRPVLASIGTMGGPSLRLLCGTVALHLDAGGRLSSELERLATAADEARRVEDDRVAATSQARATVRVVAILPLLALAGAQFASSDFLPSVAADPIALGLLLLGLMLEVVAFVAARAIVGSAR